MNPHKIPGDSPQGRQPPRSPLCFNRLSSAASGEGPAAGGGPRRRGVEVQGAGDLASRFFSSFFPGFLGVQLLHFVFLLLQVTRCCPKPTFQPFGFPVLAHFKSWPQKPFVSRSFGRLSSSWWFGLVRGFEIQLPLTSFCNVGNPRLESPLLFHFFILT